MVERLRKKDAKILFAELYEICGGLGCNSKILDNLSAASRWIKPPHETLLPFIDKESAPAETVVMPKIAEGTKMYALTEIKDGEMYKDITDTKVFISKDGVKITLNQEDLLMLAKTIGGRFIR